MKRNLPSEQTEQTQISILDVEYLHLIKAFYANNVGNFYCLTTADIAAKLPFLRCITRAEELTQNEESFNKKNRIFVLGPVAEDLIISLLNFPHFTNTNLILNDAQYANATSINNHTLASARTIRILTEESTQLVPAAGYILMNCPSALLLNNEYLRQNALFITLTSQTTTDTLAALPKTISHLNLINLTPDQIKQLPEHIESIYISNRLDPKTIAAIPPHIDEVYVADADATRVKAIPGHVRKISLSAETTADSAAAIQPADPGVFRFIYIQDATADAVAKLPPHITTVYINNDTPPKSIAAIPATVTCIYVHDADAARIAQIPGHVTQINLSSDTTADATTAIPEANIGVNRIVNLQNATENAVAKLPAHIKTVWINDSTPLGSIAAIPPTVTSIYIYSYDANQIKAIPSHVEHIYFAVNVSTDMVAAIPQANPEIDRAISIYITSPALVQQIPAHIKTVHFTYVSEIASILAIPNTVTKIHLNAFNSSISPNEICQNIIQLLNKRPDLSCISPRYLIDLNFLDQMAMFAIERTFKNGSFLNHISPFLSQPSVKGNFTILKEYLQQSLADNSGDPSLSLKTQRVPTENPLLAFLLVHLLHQSPSPENSVLIKQYVNLLTEEQKAHLLEAYDNSITQNNPRHIMFPGRFSGWPNTSSISSLPHSSDDDSNDDDSNDDSYESDEEQIPIPTVDTVDLKYLRLIQRFYATSDFYCLTTEAIAAHLKEKQPSLRCITKAEELIQNADNFENRNSIFVLGAVDEKLIISLLDSSQLTNTKLILNDAQYTSTASINNHPQTPLRTIRIMSEASTHLNHAFGYIFMKCPANLLLNHEYLQKDKSIIALTSQTPAETLAALPQTITHVFLFDLTSDQVKQLPNHIERISLTNLLNTSTIAAIPSHVTRIRLWDAGARRVKAIPGHIEEIDLSADTTADAAAALPEADDDVDRIIHIQDAPADTVSQLPEHIKTVYIDNTTPLESIKAIPDTVTHVCVWDANADRIKAIPSHVTHIALSADTTADGAAALPEAYDGVDRIIHICNASADVVAQLPKHIKTVYIDNATPLESVAAIPDTVTRVCVWDAKTDRIKAIPTHVKHITLSADTTADAAAALPEADDDVDRIIHIQDAPADVVAQLPQYIKTVQFDGGAEAASILAIPTTVTHIEIDADEAPFFPHKICQNIIQLLNERSGLVWTTHPNFIDDLTLVDKNLTTALETILEQGTANDILSFTPWPCVKENLRALNEYLLEPTVTETRVTTEPRLLSFLLVRLLLQPLSHENRTALMQYLNLLNDQQKANLLSAFSNTNMRVDDPNVSHMQGFYNSEEYPALESTSDPYSQNTLQPLLGEGFNWTLVQFQLKPSSSNQPVASESTSTSQTTNTEAEVEVEVSTTPAETPTLQ